MKTVKVMFYLCLCCVLLIACGGSDSNGGASGGTFIEADVTAPVLTLRGSEFVRIVKDQVYVDAGADVDDNRDYDLYADSNAHAIDTSETGHYTIVYTAVDHSGNEAQALIRRVHVVAVSDIAITEGFEQEHNVSYWARTAGMALPVVTMTYDSSDYTEGTRSLHIQADIAGLSDPQGNWYYYLKLPIHPNVNAEGQLVFSADVKVDAASIDHIRLGFNQQYDPIGKSGVVTLQPYISTADEWITIQEDDLGQKLGSAAQRFAERWLAEGHKSDIGARVNYLGIFIRGTGPLSVDLHIDNISITGQVVEEDDAQASHLARWDDYKARILEVIKERELSFLAMENLVDTDGVNLSEKQQYLLDRMNGDRADIYAMFQDMFATNAQLSPYTSFFPQTLLDDLDASLAAYRTLHPRLLNSLEEQNGLNVYEFPAMEYHPLNGYDMPFGLDLVSSYDLRMARGEYTSIAILVDPIRISGDEYTAENSDFVGSQGSFAAANLDTYVAKIWYQAGLTSTVRTKKEIVQELLLKDEKLVRVNFTNKSNELRVTDNDTGIEHYIDISDPDAAFPDTRTVTFDDASTLQGFSLDSIRYKQLWSILHIPEGTPSGHYTSIYRIKNSAGAVLKEFPIHVEVLPFELDESRLRYSLYYTGKLVDDPTPIKAQEKSAAQQLRELQDMKDHGVLYPTSYEHTTKLAETLDLRNAVGLPTDRLYVLGANVFSSTARKEAFLSIMTDKGYNSNGLYVYAIDEADEEELLSEIDAIIATHALGVKVFTAGYRFTHKFLGDYLDILIFAHGTMDVESAMQVAQWHESGKEIYTYAAPQVGVENPEIYRRNFGCRLWQQGYDGAMDWVYQYERVAFWNDFDVDPDNPKPYREETFTYPTTDGLVGTIAWEGYRAAITDVRYISTLLNIRDNLETHHVDITALNAFIEGIDCAGDLDQLRHSIIDEILKWRKVLGQQNVQVN